jgi:acyl-CoA thioesterase
MSVDTQSIVMPEALSKVMGFVRLVSFDEETSRIRMEFDARKDFLHDGGVIQGGIVTGWIDMAMAFSVHLKTKYQLTPLSLDINVSFMKGALPGKVYADAWIEKQGRSIGFLQGQLLNESGEVVAKASSTVKLLPKK